MRSPEDIIKRPYITEKSNSEVALGKYTFVVDVKATKTEIRQAVERLFQVKVLKVNTINYDGKKNRLGAHEGYRADWKKAIVKIELDPKSESYLTKGAKEVASSRKYKSNIEEYGLTQ